MDDVECLCRIPCNAMPLTIIAEQECSMRTVVHVNRTAPFHIMIYIIKGSMEIIEEGTAYTLTPRSLMFLTGGLHHWGVKPYEIGTTWLYAHFYAPNATQDMVSIDSGLLGKSRNLTQKDHNRFIVLPKMIVLSDRNKMQEHMDELIQLYQSPLPSDMIRMNLKLWDILLYCVSFVQGSSEISLANDRVREVINYLTENYNRSLTSREIESLVGLSYKYICTLFHERTGMSVKEYQLMLRMRRAVKLLGETHLSIAEIAEKIGFNDAFYFSKIFRREKGMSPLMFRKSYRPRI